jgi:cobalamin biosynthesis Mg chelatase CobN
MRFRSARQPKGIAEMNELRVPESAIVARPDPMWYRDMRTGDSYLRDIDTNQVSDGSHTFGELYDQRARLFALATALSPIAVHRSHRHHSDDAPMEPGFFLAWTMAPGLSDGPLPVSFHIAVKHWHLFDHAVTQDHAPAWDGHAPADVMGALDAWIGFMQGWREQVAELAAREQT